MTTTSSGSGPPSLPSVPVPVTFHSPGPLMYKNRLQEFTSRSGIAIPVYQTVNEGQAHIPKFRSTVWVAGTSYTSQSTFPQKKAAEQEVARLALETILQRTRNEGPSLVSEISPFCKSIINEYAAKLYIERPTYNTVQNRLGGMLPVFTTSLVFNGTSYTGYAARTKKEAEQSAAQAAILSIMGDSSSGTKLIELIKSKSIFYDAIKGKGLSLLQATAVLSMENSGHICVTLDHKDTVNAGSVADNNEVKVDYPESSKVHSTCQEFQLPKQESSLQTTNSLKPGSTHSIENDSSSKKRRKNKKKANKKSRLESPLPITAVPMNQVPPPCTAVPLNQVPPCTAVPLDQSPLCTAVPLNQSPLCTAVPLNQVPPCAVPMNQVPPCTAVPLNPVPPCTAVPLNQVPPCTAVPLNQVSSC
ncbi:unnamed protein product [Sphenostylis stenocarpa]|uniref:DRBM domain-containing protein n=1 Tax=Sphenostylis stenocarpa TaxID=92480 RepID=A0AA86STW7_9FABA|nr:unnamed protein product [Sphenostylis stenocarpa]